MYPSGVWRGFWQQEGFGRQPMDEFRLSFQNGFVTGHGVDCVGVFTVKGEYDSRSGAVNLVKQYLGKHTVLYHGTPDGEGSILGTWRIEHDAFGIAFKGPFLLQPVRDRQVNDLPIQDL